jgi:uncharacterized membrane protein YgdD (TMEM256/DUF423 family)
MGIGVLIGGPALALAIEGESIGLGIVATVGGVLFLVGLITLLVGLVTSGSERPAK